MQCCVPFCRNTSDKVSTSEGQGKGISFHGFPSEEHLRAAWLRALGKQDSHLPDSAVVCSQHFLYDDIYETQSGLRQIATGAIPSTVQVCMICLDTDSKLILMSKHKLEKAYEKLTGHRLCDQGNLKQTLCVQCAQRLINFSRFRDKSLRNHALMMDLVEKHELITRQHIKKISHAEHQLKGTKVLTMLGLNNCGLNILEHPSEDKQIQKPRKEEEENGQTELEETGQRVVVKTEESDVSMSVDGDTEVLHEHNNDDDSVLNDDDPLKYESITFQCTLCMEEFVHENAYITHVCVHLQNGAGDGECDTSEVCKPHTAVSSSSSHSSLITENKQADPSPSAQVAQTSVASVSAIFATNNENKVLTTKEAEPEQKVKQERETNNVGLQNTYVDSKIFTNCEVRLSDIFRKSKALRQDQALTKTRKSVTQSSVSSIQNIASVDFSHQATSQNEVPMTEYIEPVTNSRSRVKVTVSKTLQSKTDDINNIQCNNSSQYNSHIAKSSFICDICGNFYNLKWLLVKHVKTHSEIRQFTCKICHHISKCKSHLAQHMRTHTREKPFTCSICNSKFALNCHLVYHMRTHTGIKPYACELCEYKCAKKSNLVYHMTTHTGIKPYACELCEYKCARKGNLVRHMRIHTGEKPYSCNICNSKFALNCHLVYHMRTHTGIKPYACELCEYKCAKKSNLVYHMRTHTCIKPYACELCEYRSAKKSYLTIHMSTHIGVKPYACELCEYRSAKKSYLTIHMRTHTGIKPYACELCEYKCAQKGSLVRHMRTHTNVREYKCSSKSSLVYHMRIHTGIKP